MNFNLSVQKWHLVSGKGLPKDGTWCFLVWKSAKDEYEWTIGGYNEAEKYFYANLVRNSESTEQPARLR